MNKLVHALSVIFLLCCGGVADVVYAEERSYGSLIHTSDIPNALFFMDAIRDGDDFELRKALRNHDIETIVLASPGGSVWAALSMAGIIFDKKLRVMVPPKSICASACSYMFFGGAERLSEGKLGVHQFASIDQKETANAIKTQAQSQFTVSEIIGFLNEFNTPRFVFERMFEDREMYWFNSEERALLNSTEFSLEPKVQSDISKYASAKSSTSKAEVSYQPKYTVKELVALIQQRLNEIGCSAGVADGVWGRKTQEAAIQFAKKAGLSTLADDLISEPFFEALAGAKDGFCLEAKSNSPETFASIYEYSCNGGPVFNDLWSVDRHDKKNQIFFMVNNKGEEKVFEYSGDRLKASAGLDGQLFFTDKGYVYKIMYGSENCSKIIFQPRE